jgi:class 3 adenylate cyclase
MNDSIRSESPAAAVVRHGDPRDALQTLLRDAMARAAGSRLDRRLAAVLIADVVGYARLMERDEAGTHFRLRVLRRELIDPTIELHAGRIVRSRGDDVLVSFPSATCALRCAIEIQRALARCNEQVAEDERIRLRMGLNVADILFDGDDIAGSGVNLAARLEALATPGEICISQALKDHVQDELDVDCTDLGLQRVKNFSRPVRVWRVRPVSGAVPAPLRERITATLRGAWSWAAVASSAAAIATIATVAALAVSMPVFAG